MAQLHQPRDKKCTREGQGDKKKPNPVTIGKKSLKYSAKPGTSSKDLFCKGKKPASQVRFPAEGVLYSYDEPKMENNRKFCY